MPCTRTRVFLSTKMLTSSFSWRPLGRARRRQGLLCRVAEVVRGDDLQLGLGQDLLAQVDVRALEPHHERYRETHLACRRHDAVGDDVALHDATEDVDE